jgi:uncharacterized protein (DUF1330 family)
MPLLEQLGLVAPAAFISRSSEPVDASDAGEQPSSRRSAKSARVQVIEGEPTIVAQIALGKIHWGGKFRGQLWGLAGPDGALAHGGSAGHLKDLAAMNDYGARALAAIGELDTLERQWRSEHAAVRAAASDATADLQKLQKALPAMRQRRKADADFFEDVDGYLVALTRAESYVGRFREAEQGFEQAANLLKVAIYQHKIDEAGAKTDAAKAELQALQGDIDEAKRIFGSVFDTVVQVAKQDWEGLATKAISYLGEKSIDASYGPQLKELQKKLDAAKGELTRLKTAALITGIEAARNGVNMATIRLENLQAELRTALDELDRHRAHAGDELKESASTAIVGQLIAQRATQLRAIGAARATCARYQRVSQAVAGNIAEISRQYSLVGAFLDNAARADAAFERSTAYAKLLERSSRSNAVELDQWGTWVASAQRECSQAMAWLGDAGPKGPMGPFDKSTAMTREGLKDPA